MSQSLSPDEWKAELQWAEETGNTEYYNQIVQDVFGGNDPVATAAPETPAEPEPSFLDNWGRVIGETGGALVGGALGTPGGIPGIMAGAALGGEGAGYLYDKIAGNEPRSPQEVMTGAAFNAMGGPTPPLGRGPAMLTDDALDIARIQNPQPTVGDVAAEVSRRGGTTTPGQRGTPPFKYIEGALESSPFAGPTMERNRQGTLNIFGDIIDEATPRATSRESTGEAVAEGYQFNVDRAHAQVEDAYRTFDRLIEEGGGRAAKIPANALQDLSAQVKELRRVDGQFADLVYQDTDLSRAIDAIDDMVSRGESPSYDILKRLRTMIGKKIDFNSPGSEQIGLKQLYETLTRDLAEGAAEIGGEAAQNAARTADQMFSTLQVQLKALDPVFKYAETPSAMYDALSRSLLNNPKLANSAKTAMGPNAWDTFRDTWLRQNTRATPRGQDLTGQAASPHTSFSALMNLKKQSPEGYELLTQGRQEGIAVVERLADMMKEGESFVNYSRTGNTVNTGILGGDIIGGTIGALGGLLGGGPTAPMIAGGIGLITRPVISKLMAKALTSRRLNDALVKVSQKYEQLPVGEDLIRALVAAGADEYEVNEIFDKPSAPERGAANANLF